jgi:hypothetical protein
MSEPTSALVAWQNFYVIVGSAGGALIGLQFVVITLIAGRGRGTTSGGLGAFATPTVVHLTGALTVSSLMCAPWPSATGPSAAVGLTGAAGLVYSAFVARRARRQTAYVPVWEDWLWYTVLPSLVYAALGVAALLTTGGALPLFVIAGGALGLLLIGIHNAWDTVTHIVVSHSEGGGE